MFDIAILGLGTVGHGIWRIVTEGTGGPEAAGIRIRKIVEKDRTGGRYGESVDRSLLTDRFEDVLEDDSIEIVAECIGGMEPAGTFIRRCLEKGKTVVTSNKQVIANRGAEFVRIAERTGAGLYIEATVGGGIPVLRCLEESMQGNRIDRVMGIVNGTTNYILTRMCDEGCSYEEALRAAQELGYAEADPTADVEGFDAAYKLTILSGLAFGHHTAPDAFPREGITAITREDLLRAKTEGKVLRLIARGERADGGIALRVGPEALPETHPLARIDGVQNGILLTGANVGDVLLTGAGAGSLPTAGAVVSDICYAHEHMGRHRLPVL